MAKHLSDSEMVKEGSAKITTCYVKEAAANLFRRTSPVGWIGTYPGASLGHQADDPPRVLQEQHDGTRMIFSVNGFTGTLGHYTS